MPHRRYTRLVSSLAVNTLALVAPMTVWAQGGSIPATACLSPVPGSDLVIRGTGKPVTVTRVLPLGDFSPPFVLHVENGNDDGSGRASSAWVSLNRVAALGPQDFSQQIRQHEIPLTLSGGLSELTLDVRVASKPGSVLRVWVTGRSATVSPYEQVTLSPAGGRYRLRGGIVLDVPPGAVAGATVLGACPTAGSLIEPVISSYGLLDKAIAGGLEVEGPDLTFASPVSVTLPVRPRTLSSQTPVLVRVDMATGRYSLEPTDLLFAPLASTVTMQVFSLRDLSSTQVLTSSRPRPQALASIGQADDGDMDALALFTPGRPLRGPSSGWGTPDAGWLSRLLDARSGVQDQPPSKCEPSKVSTTQLVYVKDEYLNGIVCGTDPGWETDCRCVGSFRVKSLDYDVSAVDEFGDSCHVTESTIRTVYTEGACAGMEHYEKLREVLIGTLVVSPRSLELEACATGSLSTVLCSAAGKEISGAGISWSASGPVTLAPTTGAQVGVAAGLRGGDAVARAKAACGVEGWATLKVYEPLNPTVTIGGVPASLRAGQEFTPLATVAADALGQLSCASVSWTSSNPEVLAILDATTGRARALKVGTAVLTATADAANSPSASVTIDVQGTPSKVRVLPTPATMTLRSELTFSAVVLDEEGTPLPNIDGPLVWTATGVDGLVSVKPSSDTMTATVTSEDRAGKISLFACFEGMDPKASGGACVPADVTVSGPSECAYCLSFSPTTVCRSNSAIRIVTSDPMTMDPSNIRSVTVGGIASVALLYDDKGVTAELPTLNTGVSYEVRITLKSGQEMSLSSPLRVEDCESVWLVEAGYSYGESCRSVSTNVGWCGDRPSTTDITDNWKVTFVAVQRSKDVWETQDVNVSNVQETTIVNWAYSCDWYCCSSLSGDAYTACMAQVPFQTRHEQWHRTTLAPGAAETLFAQTVFSLGFGESNGVRFVTNPLAASRPFLMRTSRRVQASPTCPGGAPLDESSTGEWTQYWGFDSPGHIPAANEAGTLFSWSSSSGRACSGESPTGTVGWSSFITMTRIR